MLPANERFKGNQYRATRVCVDSYEDGIFVGRFYNPGSSQEYAFKSMSQFLTQMEDLLDQMQFPQAFTAVRTFSMRPTEAISFEDSDMAKETGRLATFVVRVLFRQNASWQGSLTWEDTGQEENFRSALELIFLMDSALTGESG